ncbi:MAG TPA: selenoneine synthase SenA [Terriglobia bacterium]|nr:selenoneine synthase SenA [Terriglobia bacterium]
MIAMPAEESPRQLARALQEGRARTLELIADLSDEQMIGPRLAIVNPLRWEIGHVAWFQEYWVLRHFRKEAPTRREGDSLYDSARIAHDIRWDLPLPSKAETLAYIQHVLDRVLEKQENPGPAAGDGTEEYDEAYFMRLALFHECMHAEAITYTRQTLNYAAPGISGARSRSGSPEAVTSEGGDGRHLRPVLGDAEIPGGTFLLGSTRNTAFVFDNEQWAHPVTLKPFRMSRTAVSNTEFAAFVDDAGYQRRDLWTEEGWRWRVSAVADHPVYWQKQAGGRWLRRNFDEWIRLEPRRPVLHVNWYEADAYCRWAGRRLPTEAEWEMAASAEPSSDRRGLTPHKRLFPWGDEAPTPARANLDWRAMDSVDVDALPAGDSAFGCRQMIGNVWEWTATDFGPYPGFSPGPYKEYSAPWFEDHKVLRGGCWATRSGLIRNNYRNFYQPHRRDVWCGFRTCAL